MANVTSSAICSALKLRFPAESHALMFEVAPSTGGGTRYADAVAVGLWASHGHLIQGIEIKVSRGDFLSEMKKPEKSEPVMRYCGRWWLACPKGMVKPEELPPTWGMLELDDKGALRVKVKAPILKPEPVTLGFFASLCRRRAGYDEAMSKNEINRLVKVSVDYEKERLQGAQAQKLGYRHQQIVDAEAKIAAILEATGIDLTKHSAEDDVIAAVRMFQAIQGAGNWQTQFERLHSVLHQATKAFADAGIPRAA